MGILERVTINAHWYYSGTHWKRITDEWLYGLILNVLDDVILPGRSTYRNIADAASKLLIGLSAVEGDALRLADEPPPVVNCRNGELWIGPDGAVQLRPHSPSSFLTYCLDVEYDPSATCPRYDDAVLGIFANASNADDMVRHWHEIFGYALQPVRDIPAYLILRGAGDNGKSKLVQTVMHLMGPGAVYAARIDKVENNRFALGALAGKLLFVDDDVTTGTRLPDGFLKLISEQKPLTGEHKFKDQFQFVCVAMPILLCNNYPHVSDLSHGMLRRAYILPFDRTFTDEDRDPGLFPGIWEHEMSGILNRALEGLQRLRERGRFELPEDCERARDEWLAIANPLVSFVNEVCTIGPNEHVFLNPLYLALTHWADNAGIRNIPTRNQLKANLVNLGYNVRKVKGYSEVVGLGLPYGWVGSG